MSEATRIIAFYGFKGGSGRSLLAANMAGVMAALGKRVLVIDCDLEAPGIGDYFDRPGEDIFTDSRSRKGILDLIVDRDVPPTPAAVTERLFGAQGLLVPADPDGRFLIEVARNGAGSIHLLGPGSHTNGEASAHHYLAKLINFDWNVFLGNNGGQFLAALGHALRSSSSPFDYVLLDARTGYNLPSVMLVRYLATDVVIVGTMAMQSIDGIARMEPLFSDIQGIDGAVKCHLVIGKDPSGKPPSEGTGDRTGDLETAFKASLIDEYHHALAATVYRLPFVDEFQRGDNLSWARLKADVVEFIGREEPAGAAAPATSTTGGDGERHGEEHTFKVSYCREFARLYRAVTGHELTKEHFTLVLGM